MMAFTKHTLLFSLSTLVLAGSSLGHISYTGRNFGTFDSSSQVIISNQTVGGAYGWADGTDADFGDSHRLRAYRFTLSFEADVSITATATTNNGALLGDLFPAFSIYQGLAHGSPADYDTAAISSAYLSSLPGVTKEGAFVALGDWKIGNDAGATFTDLSSFTYAGHAADGDAANYGNAIGIFGDGLADDTVTANFHLPAGTYSLFLGGANYNSTGTANRGVNLSLTVVPEPTTTALSMLVVALGIIRRRR